MGKIIAVANQKGGVGKTTTSITLSALLAKKGKKVILIDADPQGNATSGVGLQGQIQKSVYELLVEDIKMEETLVQTNSKNLKVCPSELSKLFWSTPSICNLEIYIFNSLFFANLTSPSTPRVVLSVA